MSIHANRSAGDAIIKLFLEEPRQDDVLYLASPFFSADKQILTLAERGCAIRLIVRLGPRTAGKSLLRCVAHENVQIRFFTSERFHSKLYIFGHHLAMVGSANLTEAALMSNQEIAVTFEPHQPEFDELLRIYQGYWGAAEVLDKQRANQYANLCRTYRASSADGPLERAIKECFGDIMPNDEIRVGRPQPSKERLFLSNYRRIYQEFLAAYRLVEQAYKEDGRRLQPEERVPLRIEIDQFFSFIRDRYTTGDSYLEQPFRAPTDIISFTSSHFDEWFRDRWAHLDNYVPGNFARINERLGSRAAINAASLEQLFDALLVCHSFHDRFRFYKGGHPTMRKEFLADNKLPRVREVLSYLLHGKDDFIERMATCIFDPAFDLAHVGRSVIQETFGWVNRDNIPVCNGRTVKALRYLGADVQIFT